MGGEERKVKIQWNHYREHRRIKGENTVTSYHKVTRKISDIFHYNYTIILESVHLLFVFLRQQDKLNQENVHETMQKQL